MGIARVARRHCEPLLPLRKKARLQEAIGLFDRSDFCQTHFLYQAVLQSLEEPLDASLRLRTMRCDPFKPEVLQDPAELRLSFFPL